MMTLGLIAAISLIAPPKNLHPITAVANVVVQPDLLADITQNLRALSIAGKNRYNLDTISTDKALWIWPCSISCVGLTQPWGYQSVLIAPNWVLANEHTGARFWTNTSSFFIFDTNGTAFSIPYSGTNYRLGDMVLCKLVTNAPASCVPPWLFTWNYTNYFDGHTPVGMPCFWLHQSQLTAEFVRLSFYDMPDSGYGTTEICLPQPSNPQGGTMGQKGDSGSPCFTMLRTRPVLLFATTAAYPSGCGVSDGQFFNFITNAIPESQLKILDLSAYPTK